MCDRGRTAICDHERLHHRRRRLFPSVGAGAAHRPLELGRAPMPRRAKRRPSARTAGQPWRQGHVLYARLDRQALSAAWCARSWLAVTRLASHGFGHLRASEQTPAEFRADVRQAKRLLEDIAAQPVIGLPRAELFDRLHQPLGLRCAGRRGLSLQLERLPGSARPLRHARRAALSVPGAPAADRDSAHDDTLVGAQPSGRRRWLLSLGALQLEPLGAAPRQSCGRQIRDPGGGRRPTRAASGAEGEPVAQLGQAVEVGPLLEEVEVRLGPQAPSRPGRAARPGRTASR